MSPTTKLIFQIVFSLIFTALAVIGITLISAPTFDYMSHMRGKPIVLTGIGAFIGQGSPELGIFALAIASVHLIIWIPQRWFEKWICTLVATLVFAYMVIVPIAGVALFLELWLCNYGLDCHVFLSPLKPYP